MAKKRKKKAVWVCNTCGVVLACTGHGVRAAIERHYASSCPRDKNGLITTSMKQVEALKENR